MACPVAEPSSSFCLKSNGLTEQAITRVHYKWDIVNFSLFGEVTGVHMMSPEFSAHDDDKLRWRLKLFPRGLNMECENYVSIFLEMVSHGAKNFHATFQFALLNKWGEKVFSSVKLMFPHSSSLSKSNGLRDFIERKTLSDEKKGLLADDILTVLCDIDIISERPHARHQQKEEIIQTVISSKQQVHFYERLFQSMPFTDVTFCVENHKLKAHKAILAASSLVFESMFTLGGEVCNQFLVSGIKWQVFYEMLRYIYTGNIHEWEGMAEELLHAAQRYQLMELEEFCRYPARNKENSKENLHDTSSSSTDGLAREAIDSAPSSKGRRGRPPKITVMNDVKNLDDFSPKRQRGRPRKYFPGATSIADPITKRKRGRPPKVNRLSAPNLRVASANAADSQAKRKRGRPPKNSSANVTAVSLPETIAASDDELVVNPKRKSGRPRKSLPVDAPTTGAEGDVSSPD